MTAGIDARRFISVVVTGKNAAPTIDECLHSIFHVKYPTEDFEVIYVDAESTDGSFDIVKREAAEHRNLRYFLQGGLPGKGRNVGIRKSQGQIVAFTDADCVVDESWLINIVSHLASQGEDVAGVGGPAITPNSDVGLASHIGRLWETRFGSAGARNPARYLGLRFVDHNPTCNCAYRRWVFDKVGLFNESLPVTEDEELDTRIRKHGYRLLYADNMIVWHHRKNTLGAFARQMYFFGFWRAQSGKRGMVPLKPWHFGPPSLIVYLIVFPFFASVELPISLIPLAAYLFVGVASGASAALRSRDAILLLSVPALGFAEHLAYGVGVISGLLHSRGANA
jgi:glycosyltransferase involved in cell wall biosynthesis